MGKVRIIQADDTMPKDCGARDFFPEQTIAQIGRMTILAISGGRISPIVKGANQRVVGLALPVSHGYEVRIYLAANDTYTVQRTWRGRVKGQQTDVYDTELGDVAYEAHAFQSYGFPKGEVA